MKKLLIIIKDMLRGVILVYLILYYSLMPIIISILPVIPYIITNDPNYMWLMLISVGVGISYGIKLWEGDFIDRHM